MDIKLIPKPGVVLNANQQCSAIRAAMKLELNHTNISLPSVDMDMEHLFDEVAAPPT